MDTCIVLCKLVYNVHLYLINRSLYLSICLTFEIYDIYYKDMKQLSYVGFKKMHPHDTHSTLRIAFIEPTAGKDTVRQMLASVFEKAFKEISHVKGLFGGK